MQLNRFVTAGGVVYPAGTVATADLLQRIPNPEYWDGEPTESIGYDGLKVDELKAEIASRNEGRDEGDLISDDGRKADLVAALELDDEAREG